MSNSGDTLDNYVSPKRFLKTDKKTEVKVAPWSRSTFETEYDQQKKLSEYIGVFQPTKVYDDTNYPAN